MNTLRELHRHSLTPVSFIPTTSCLSFATTANYKNSSIPNDILNISKDFKKTTLYTVYRYKIFPLWTEVSQTRDVDDFSPHSAEISHTCFKHNLRKRKTGSETTAEMKKAREESFEWRHPWLLLLLAVCAHNDFWSLAETSPTHTHPPTHTHTHCALQQHTHTLIWHTDTFKQTLSYIHMLVLHLLPHNRMTSIHTICSETPVVHWITYLWFGGYCSR